MRALAVGALISAAAAAATLVPGAKTVPPALPAPSFSVSGQLFALAAAGYRVGVAVGTEGCGIRVARLVAGKKAKPVAVKAGASACGNAQPFVLWLGRRALAAELLSAESPHGEDYSLWKGSLLSGPLRVGVGEWGWRDDNPDESAYGCAWAVAAGGGVIAAMPVPNRLAVDQGLADRPSCPGKGTASIMLDGASRARTTVAGSWTLLATDGKRLALSRLDVAGLPSGELSLVGLDGKPLPTPQIDRATVKAARTGWLAADGLVLLTGKGIKGPGWTIARATDATVAYGRVIYSRRNALRVRRIKDGVDRPLLTLPSRSEPLLAAGSFGLAVAVESKKQGGDGYRTNVYRIGWRVIDGVLPQR